jgi:hypothetical protein
MQLKRSSLVRAFAGAVGVLALSLSAGAQQFPSCPPPGAGTGPDVIVGDLNGVQNYTASGSLEALALGTTSCNVGTQNLNWIQNSPNHPLIAASVYKIKNVGGSMRCEQLGMSWLKHAFAAFQEFVCCSNCPGGGLSSHLGVGCSDPYTPGRNGTQSLLGPHYQVNPNTGTYVVSHPSPSGGNNGRIQIETASLEPNSGSVIYFGEGAYVALDDSQFDNNDNNASWRQMTVSGSGSTWTFGVTGTTRRMQTAIDAWRNFDSNVRVTNVTVPESSSGVYDGNARVIIGSAVTDLGGGQWHYEYLIENLNSDRAIQSFSVPISPGTVVTNVDFHDVAYRGGDGVTAGGAGGTNYDGTDWPSTVGASTVSWATQTFAVHQGANALRFGTAYNFRFDANVAPVTGPVTLGQFKVVNNVVANNVDVPGNATPPFQSYCPGIGCPCANDGSGVAGCANSAFAAGGLLTATGNPSVSSDSVLLQATNLTGSVAVFFQGATQTPATIIDDGLGCVGGPIVRLGTEVVGANTGVYPDLGDQPVSIRGSIPGAGGTFYYQCFYRNAVAAFCPPATSNRTNGLIINWTP